MGFETFRLVFWANEDVLFETSLWDLKLSCIFKLLHRVKVRNLPMGFETCQEPPQRHTQEVRNLPMGFETSDSDLLNSSIQVRNLPMGFETLKETT